ncbi:T9SS type A sorting domain-containing protein [Flavobacterium sp. XS2P39]|uniref:T9SS type A sorting domain-containing protein n=1 Tax=Flavobacterium sp. XS2P39 TaxID=3401725 RepID=UPI003AAC27B3
MKHFLLSIILFITCTNLTAQELNFISGPVGHGTNVTADDRTLLPFFKDQSYIYCSTYKVVSTNPITRKGCIVRVDISNGSQYIYPDDVYLPANGASDAKKLNGNIFFNIGIRLAKINTTTNKLTVISNDAEDYALFDHYIIYENYNYSGLYIVDLNTNATTQIFSPNNRKFYRLGATYYDNGVLYFRSQYTTTGVYYGIYKYIPATKSITEIVGRNVVTGSDIYQNRDEIARVNDNIVFLMKDTDYTLKYFSVNLTTQSLNTSFTFNTKQIYDTAVNDLMVFNNTVYLTNEGKVFISDGVTTPQATNYPLFIGYGLAGSLGDVLYFKNEAYFQLNTPEYGYEIWKYDGTMNDKQLVKDITPGTESSFAINKNGFINNNKLFYTVNTGPLAYSLYTTDGTSEGTVCLLDHFTYLSFTALFFEGDTICFYGQNDTNKGLFVYSPTTTPIFATVPEICAGERLLPLPTTSTNGITGTWSPALNNTSTTNYIFTPTAGQSASITTMTIEVNPIITPEFTAVDAICSGAILSPLPTTSNNGISGTWSPALNNITTTEYTFTPTNQCATTFTMTIPVNPTPAAPIAAGQTLGIGDTVDSLRAQGNNLKWYLTENATAELASNTILIEGLYYVSQTVNTCESERTAVVVILTTLGIDDSNAIRFSLMAFPNPFKDTFGVEINVETQETARILIYDNLGKLIEKKEGTPIEISHYEFGKNYPIGIYNIILNQSGKTNTFRMIKG